MSMWAEGSGWLETVHLDLQFVSSVPMKPAGSWHLALTSSLPDPFAPEQWSVGLCLAGRLVICAMLVPD